MSAEVVEEPVTVGSRNAGIATRLVRLAVAEGDYLTGCLGAGEPAPAAGAHSPGLPAGHGPPVRVSKTNNVYVAHDLPRIKKLVT